MTDLVFVDTNVIVYQRDATEPEKQPRAAAWMETLWRRRIGRISTQVLNEFYVTVTRKLSPGLPAEEARQQVADYFAWSPLPVDGRLISRAWGLEQRYAISYWDALIVAAAQLARCRYVLTEDLQHDQSFDSVQVKDPFRTDLSLLES